MIFPVVEWLYLKYDRSGKESEKIEQGFRLKSLRFATDAASAK
jgi:hypothetical protein